MVISQMRRCVDSRGLSLDAHRAESYQSTSMSNRRAGSYVRSPCGTYRVGIDIWNVGVSTPIARCTILQCALTLANLALLRSSNGCQKHPWIPSNSGILPFRIEERRFEKALLHTGRDPYREMTRRGVRRGKHDVPTVIASDRGYVTVG